MPGPLLQAVRIHLVMPPTLRCPVVGGAGVALDAVEVVVVARAVAPA